MEAWELEQVRRSIAMLPEGHSAGALTKERAMALVHEALAAREDRERYRQAVDKLRAVLDELDGPPDSPSTRLP
jgi:hypothetical protein